MVGHGLAAIDNLMTRNNKYRENFYELYIFELHVLKYVND